MNSLRKQIFFITSHLLPHPPLRLKREKVSHVFVVGLATNYCCKFTAKDAKDAGFVTTLLLPLTRGVGDAGSLFDPADTIIELKKHGVRVVLDLSVLLQ